MKKTVLMIICAAMATTTLTTFARVKKNDPDKKEVLKELEEIGEGHFVERMKVSDLCTLEFEDENGEDIFYHVYVGTLKNDKYHLIFYDNTPTYLGYYLIDHEPVDYEDEAVLLDTGEANEDGDSEYFEVALKKTGPIQKIRVDGVPVTFQKNPKLEAKAEGQVAATGGIPVVPKETSETGEVIDYRDWTITIKGNTVTVNAIFVKVEGGKVTIKNAKNGKEAQIPGSALSDEDKEYVKRITGK